MKRQDCSQDTGAEFAGVAGRIGGRGSYSRSLRHAHSHKGIRERGISCRIRGYLCEPEEVLPVSKARWIAGSIGEKLHPVNGIGETVHVTLKYGVPPAHCC